MHTTPHHHKPGPSLMRGGLIVLLLLWAPLLSRAAEWQKLTQTTNHNVAIGMEALQSTPNVTTLLLQFTPRGELQRRLAAQKYGFPHYLKHQEQYEIDCGEKKARLDFIDILGWRDKRLTRMTGSGRMDAITPGSVLAKAAELLCPDEGDGDDDGMAAATGEAPTEPPLAGIHPQPEMEQRIDTAQRRTALDPNDFNAWAELGNAWFDADVAAQAIQAYDHALAIRPDDADVLNDQGAMFYSIGDTRRAVANFERVLAIDPGNLESLYNLGYICAFDLQQGERAREIWRRYLALDSQSETAEQVRTFMKQLETPAGKK